MVVSRFSLGIDEIRTIATANSRTALAKVLTAFIKFKRALELRILPRPPNALPNPLTP